MPNYRVIKNQSANTNITTTDYGKDESLTADLKLSHSLYQSLHQNKSSLSDNTHMVLKENIKEHLPFNIFYEGIRTNNTFVNRMPDSFMIELLQIAKNKNINICFVKINHKNKNHCIPAGPWYVNFFKSLIQKSLECEIEYSMIKAENLAVIDTIKLAFNKLYLESGNFYDLNADSANYKEFLDYFNNNKVKTE